MSESEVFLNQGERLDVIKGLLRDVVNAVAESNDENIDRILGELVFHVEAAGPELKLNELEGNILNSIKLRINVSSRGIAQLCARLLGALDHETRFPDGWKSEKDLIKEVFIFELNQRIDAVLNGINLLNVLKLEELISGFTVHEESGLDPEVLKLCYGVEECINDVLVYGNELDTTRLLIQKKTALTIQGKIRIALS
ncbi:hypothetical protein C0416_01120 [bacterium]|nr:hypothetical protein [bacterium]